MADRPRDRLGRPLPSDADPATVAPPVSDVVGRDDAAVWSIAVDYLDDGLPFHAHEVFEQRWREARDDDRGLWQALAQWGAALTHQARGNPVGAARVAERALTRLQECPAASIPSCVDIDRVRDSCRALMAT